MTKINGIPTPIEFRKSVGRYGIRRKFRSADHELERIVTVLELAQAYRNFKSQRAHDEMRRLRKACINWLAANRDKKRFEKKPIQSLGLAADARLEILRNLLFAPSPAKVQQRALVAAHGMARDTGLTMNGTFGKAIDPEYNIERFSSNNLPGPLVEMSAERKYQDFKARHPGTRLTVEDYVKHCLIPDSQDDPSSALLFARTTQSVQLLQNGVKYCNAKERLNYRLNFMGEGIVMYADGYRFHTGGMHTNSAGEGWAIFVVDFNQTFYAGPHAVNEFHHSSFLAGDAVYAAGEIAVDNGTVVGMTNKTGHYKAGPDELDRALRLLQRDAGVNLDNVAVTDPFRGSGMWRWGSDVIAAGGDFASAALQNAAPAAPPTVG